MSHAVRATRIDTHRVRVGTADGILLNLSASGALVRLPRFFNAEADTTLSFLTDDHWLDVPCKVVRCTEAQVEIAGATWKRKDKEFETAVTFNDGSVIAGLLTRAEES